MKIRIGNDLESMKEQGYLPHDWVAPFYLKILRGNYASDSEDTTEIEKFNLLVKKELKRVNWKQLSRLIGASWREALTGSWFAGIGGFVECRNLIGEQLIASKTCYAGQAHAFALACFADEESADYLETYLDKFLRRKKCEFDQDWAMPALMWIDQESNLKRSKRFLVDGGLWEEYTADKVKLSNSWTLESCKTKFWRSMSYCSTHFRSR